MLSTFGFDFLRLSFSFCSGSCGASEVAGKAVVWWNSSSWGQCLSVNNLSCSGGQGRSCQGLLRAGTSARVGPGGLRKDFNGNHLPSLFEKLLGDLPALRGAAQERFHGVGGRFSLWFPHLNLVSLWDCSGICLHTTTQHHSTGVILQSAEYLTTQVFFYVLICHCFESNYRNLLY